MAGVEADLNAGPLRKTSRVRPQGGQKPQVIQHGRPQFPREPVHGFDHLLQQGLGIGQLLIPAVAVDVRSFLQHGEVDADGGQDLPDFIVQLAADPFSFFFLHVQDAA